MEKRPRLNPLLVLAFGILAVSTASILVRYAQEEAPSLVIAAWRLSLAAIILAPLALTRDRTVLRALQRNEIALALLAGFFLALHFATWISSLEFTTVASSAVLVTTTPLWVALVSPIFLKEPITRPVMVGMILALIGGITIGLSDTCIWQSGALVCPDLGEMVRGRAFLGDLLALAGAMFAAAYVIIGRKLRGQYYPAELYLPGVWGCGNPAGYSDAVHRWQRLRLSSHHLPVVSSARPYPPIAGSLFVQLGIKVCLCRLCIDHTPGGADWGNHPGILFAG